MRVRKVTTVSSLVYLRGNDSRSSIEPYALVGVVGLESR